jgi:DNA-binding MarR family transcriptional regulator
MVQGNVSGHAVDGSVVDAVLTASRTMVGVATRSLGEAAEDTTIAQYRMLVVLASRGPQRMVDLALGLGVAPSTAGRMSDRLVRKQLVRRHRARADRRSVLVSVTAAGRQVVDEATARRRVLIAGILAKLPAAEQQAIAAAFASFTEAAGEIPDSLWPPVIREAPLPGAGRASSERLADGQAQASTDGQFQAGKEGR